MRSNDPGRLSSCLGTRYQAVSHLLPIARRVSPCLLGRGSTRRARTVSPCRHRAPRQRAYDFLPARPPSPRFRTGETVSMLPTDDCFPTLVGEHSRLVRFRVTRDHVEHLAFHDVRYASAGRRRCEGRFRPLDSISKVARSRRPSLWRPCRNPGFAPRRFRLRGDTTRPGSPRPVSPPSRERRRLPRSEAPSLVR